MLVVLAPPAGLPVILVLPPAGQHVVVAPLVFPAKMPVVLILAPLAGQPVDPVPQPHAGQPEILAPPAGLSVVLALPAR